MFAIYDLATGEWNGTPVETDARDEVTQGAREIQAGWPDLYAWSAAQARFVRVAAPALFTFNQWVDLFPLPEQVAIVTATMTDPMAKLIYDRAQSASGSIDPADPRTLAGLGYLVSKGWISQATLDRIAGA